MEKLTIYTVPEAPLQSFLRSLAINVVQGFIAAASDRLRSHLPPCDLKTRNGL
jgi:hypothetical protein